MRDTMCLNGITKNGKVRRKMKVKGKAVVETTRKPKYSVFLFIFKKHG